MKLGCSSFTWETLDEKHLLGRTYDQIGNLEGNKIAVIPRGYEMKTEINAESGYSVKSEYSVIGMAVMGLEAPVMVDGVNEKGLMGALLHYPGYAVYDTQRNEKNINVQPGYLIGYLLGQCATLEEAAKTLSGLNLTEEKIFGKEIRVHFIFSDKTGEAVIVEPDGGGIRIHRDTIGVMTNSPDYLWHKTNLRNYASVTNLYKPARKLINIEIAGFGDGAGASFGLPGDYSSPSRFVRTAFLKNYAVRGRDEVDGITRMFRNFAAVDIPEGILKEHEDYEVYEQTLCISAMCAESLTYYFATSSNRRISAISLEKEKNNTRIKFFDLQEKQDILYLN